MKGHVRKRCRCSKEARKRCKHSWAYVIDIGRDETTGKRQQKWVSGFKTESAAEKAMRRALTTLDDGRDPFPSTDLVRDYINRWLLQHATQVRPRTIHRYEQLLQAHVVPCIGHVRLNRLTTAQVRNVWVG